MKTKFACFNSMNSNYMKDQANGDLINEREMCIRVLQVIPKHLRLKVQVRPTHLTCLTTLSEIVGQQLGSGTIRLKGKRPAETRLAEPPTKRVNYVKVADNEKEKFLKIRKETCMKCGETGHWSRECRNRVLTREEVNEKMVKRLRVNAVEEPLRETVKTDMETKIQDVIRNLQTNVDFQVSLIDQCVFDEFITNEYVILDGGSGANVCGRRELFSTLKPASSVSLAGPATGQSSMASHTG